MKLPNRFYREVPADDFDDICNKLIHEIGVGACSIHAYKVVASTRNICSGCARAANKAGMTIINNTCPICGSRSVRKMDDSPIMLCDGCLSAMYICMYKGAVHPTAIVIPDESVRHILGDNGDSI